MLLTVFTPAYNRGHLLDLCFESLRAQEIELEWIIIDDGSTDDTSERVAKILQSAPFRVRYVWQANAGKQAAWNAAVNLAEGKYFIGLDSDDQLLNNAGTLLAKHLKRLEGDSMILGIRACATRVSDGRSDATNFFHDGEVRSWFDEFANPSSQGERIDILKTGVLKRYLYPVAENIKFIPEIWFYAKTASEGYLFLYSEEPLRLFLDNHNHLRLSRSSIIAHAKGHLISRTELLNSAPFSLWIRNPVSLAKTIVRIAQLRNAEKIPLWNHSSLKRGCKLFAVMLVPAQAVLRMFK